MNGDSQPRFSLAFCRRCATIAGLCLEVITHAPNPNDMMNLYTSFSWPTLCAEVAKLQVSLPERHTPHAVPTRSEPIVGRRAAAPEHGRPQQAQARETDQGPSSAARPHVLAGLLPEATPSDTRPMELGDADAPVPAETHGARRSFSEVAVAACGACSATCSAEIPMISSRCPGLNRGPTVYETVALPLSYSGKVGVTGTRDGRVAQVREGVMMRRSGRCAVATRMRLWAGRSVNGSATMAGRGRRRG